MPRDVPPPPPLDDPVLARSLDRYLTVGLVFMAVLVAGFVAYRVREPTLRSDAKVQQQVSYTRIGRVLFDTNCSACHGRGATGGSAPVLRSKEFLSETTDDQIHATVSAGVSGSDMAAWSLDYGGALTDEQVRQITAWIRSLEKGAPSVPDWRNGKG